MIPFSKDAGTTLRGGRQELLFGSQRLVGPGDFTQVPHTFDGAQAIFRIADWTMIPFWTQAVFVDKYKFNKSSPDHQFYGFYTTAPAHLLPLNLDLYYLGANNRGATFNGTTGRENRHTLGLRTRGNIDQTNWDFELEGAGQFGTVGSGNIGAGMFTAVLGYTFPVKEWSPRAYIEFDYASGDRKPGGRVGTFNQLFPNGHSYLGYIDYIGRQNIISPNAGIAISPIRDLTLTLQQYLFWRASDRDSIYNKSSAVLRATAPMRAMSARRQTCSRLTTSRAICKAMRATASSLAADLFRRPAGTKIASSSMRRCSTLSEKRELTIRPDRFDPDCYEKMMAR